MQEYDGICNNMEDSGEYKGFYENLKDDGRISKCMTKSEMILDMATHLTEYKQYEKYINCGRV